MLRVDGVALGFFLVVLFKDSLLVCVPVRRDITSLSEAR